MSTWKPIQPPFRRVETDVMNGTGKASITVDTAATAQGYRWRSVVEHPTGQANRVGYAPSQRLAAIEATAWLSAVSVSLEEAEAILARVISQRDALRTPRAPH